MTLRWVLALAIAAVAILAACADSGDAVDSACVPTIDASVEPPGDPNLKIEDIIYVMSGQRQTNDVPVEEKVTDPNYAGVYGDREGGIIVTVLDCSAFDIDEIAEIAGGADAVRIVEVPHNWRQVNGFADTLIAELSSAGLVGDVLIESTVEGRRIEVRTPDVDALPNGFGSTVPSTIYTIVETDAISREE